MVAQENIPPSQEGRVDYVIHIACRLYNEDYRLQNEKRMCAKIEKRFHEK